MEKFSVEITRVDDILTADAVADEKIKSLLKISDGYPLLTIKRHMRSEELPVLVDLAYAKTAIWDYRVTFRKDLQGRS